jgi:hypothetical protein
MKLAPKEYERKGCLTLYGQREPRRKVSSGVAVGSKMGTQKTAYALSFRQRGFVGKKAHSRGDQQRVWSRRFALAAGNSDSDHSVAGVVLAPLIGIERATTAAVG